MPVSPGMPNPQAPRPAGKVFACSDLHVRYPENREIVQDLSGESPHDWLIVAGDVGEIASDIEWALALLAERFERVIWTPGNHELWTLPKDPLQLRGQHRYSYLVERCRELGVITPEDAYPVWDGPGGPVVIAPLFLLYDYTFLPPGARDKEDGLRRARDKGVMFNDEYVLHPDPFPSREAWCEHRLAVTEERLRGIDPGVPLLLVNHYPLVRDPTLVLRHPEIAVWCGTERTGDWHRRFSVTAAVYGHLHIPRVTHHDGVPFVEVSLGYPAERRRHGSTFALRQVLPAA